MIKHVPDVGTLAGLRVVVIVCGMLVRSADLHHNARHSRRSSQARIGVDDTDDTKSPTLDILTIPACVMTVGNDTSGAEETKLHDVTERKNSDANHCDRFGNPVHEFTTQIRH